MEPLNHGRNVGRGIPPTAAAHHPQILIYGGCGYYVRNERPDAPRLDRASARPRLRPGLLGTIPQAAIRPICERIPHGDSTVWGLRSTAFDQLQSVEEVRAQAIIMIARLNGALRAQCGAEPLTLQGWPASTTAEIFISVSFRKPVPGRGQW